MKCRTLLSTLGLALSLAILVIPSNAYSGNALAFRLLGTTYFWVDTAASLIETKTQDRPNHPLSNATDVYLRTASTLMLDMASDFIDFGNRMEWNLDEIDEVEAIREGLLDLQGQAQERAYAEARKHKKAGTKTYTSIYYTRLEKRSLRVLGERIGALARSLRRLDPEHSEPDGF